ncbi:MAG: molybdenum cofactor biosysynthesis protein [Verrucomicrobiae bacterium]|nr:molybdenum cofactor biosysynthesis protein [Verrucomicrobiae bacterium]
MSCHVVGVKVRHLYISPGHNYFGHNGGPPGNHPTLEVPEIECVAGRGIKGDRFFDFKEDHKGQVTFFSLETFEALCAELKLSGKAPGESRRNIVVAGVDLNALVGQEFEIQGVKFRGMAECSPCHWMDRAFAPGAEHFLQKRGGLRAKVLTDGKLRVEA